MAPIGAVWSIGFVRPWTQRWKWSNGKKGRKGSKSSPNDGLLSVPFLGSVNTDLVIRADILKSWELSEDGKAFTLNMRKGLKWSDGEALDASAFTWYYEYVYQNEELTPNKGSNPFVAIDAQPAATSSLMLAPTAFLVVPLIGAFFLDIANALIIQGFTQLPFFSAAPGG